MTLLSLAYGAGLLSVINPCGFVMLPAFLALYTEAPRTGLAARLGRGLAVGMVIAAGFTAVYTTAGLALALGLRPLMKGIPWLALAIGAALTTAGIALLAGWRFGMRLNANRISRPGAGLRSAASFGLAYAVASLSCTVAVLLSVVTQALAAGDPASIAGVFAAYAAGATTLLMLLALAAALASGALARGLRRFSRHSGRIAGALLTASGLYLIAYWAPALRTGRPSGTLADAAGTITTWLTRFVSHHQSLVAIAAILLITLAIAGILVTRASAARRQPPTPAADTCCLTEASPSTHPSSGTAAPL